MSKVLVVDDESGIRSLLTTLLQEEGFEVLTAGDGKVGLGIALRERPDLILLDMMLPGMDGRTVYRCLREEEGSRRTPVIFMSAIQLPSSADSEVGMLAKPFDIDRLLDLVGELLPTPG